MIFTVVIFYFIEFYHSGTNRMADIWSYKRLIALFLSKKKHLSGAGSTPSLLEFRYVDSPSFPPREFM